MPRTSREELRNENATKLWSRLKAADEAPCLRVKFRDLLATTCAIDSVLWECWTDLSEDAFLCVFGVFC